MIWIERFSQDAVQGWKDPIDLILIDGDHAEDAVERDWLDWNRFCETSGVVIFNDARIFENGWATNDYSPVKLINRIFHGGTLEGWTIAEEIDSL